MVNHIKYSPSVLRLGRVREHLRRRKALTVIIAILATLYVVVVIFQLVYGAQSRALPFVTIDGRSIAGDDVATIERDIQTAYYSATLQLLVRDRTLNTTLAAAGLTPDTDRLIQQAVEYPLWQRFVPFTILKAVGARHIVQAELDEERFAEFVKTVVPLCLVEPTDATVGVVEGVLQLTPARAGEKCSVVSLRDQFLHMPLAAGQNSKRVAFTVAKPAVSTESARQLLTQAQTLIDRTVTLRLMDATYTLDKTVTADWIAFESDLATKQPAVVLSNDAIAAYLKTLQASIYIAPGVTVVNLFDGKEVSRAVGSSGRGIAIDDGVASIKKQLLAGDGRVDLQLAILPPTPQYSRTYSRTNAGLQALLSYLVEQKGDFSISVRQLDGAGLVANARGDKVYTPASTYKLFVAYAVLKRIESSQMNWNDQATNGHTVAACFDTMIIHSDNPCAEWFGKTIGWKAITEMLRSIGLSSATSLYTSRGFEATANDEALFLAKLQAGQLLSSASTDRLLDVMKRQIYRSGVPAGTGEVVANKVGFLNGLLHDASIVYAPGGTYVIVIMSNGSNWGQLADVARQINSWLN